MRRYVFEAAPLCVFASSFFGWLSIREGFIGSISDTAFYLTVADYFSPYRTAPHGLGASMFYDFSMPPLYPLVLAVLGGGSEHPVASYFATSCMMAAAVGAVYVWLRTERLAVAEALGLSLVFALLPATLLGVMAIQSEPLYVACTFAGFALWGVRETKVWVAPLAALCIGSSALVRAVGVSAIGALLVCWRLDRRARRTLLIPVLAVAPYLAWTIVKYVGDMQPTYLDSVVRGSFTETLDYLANQITINLPAAWSGIVQSFDLVGSPYASVACAVLLSFSVGGFALRLRKLKIDSLYVVFYLAIIIVWPYPGHMRRFLHVLMPLFLFYSYLGVGQLNYFLAPTMRRPVVIAYIVILVVVLAPSTFVMVDQVARAEDTATRNFVRSPQWYMYDSPSKATVVMERVMQIMDGMSGIDDHLPPDACVSSAAHAYIPLYGRRRSRPVAGLAVADERFFSRLRDCPYVFMMSASQWPKMDYPAMYPYERIKDQLEVVEVSLWDRTATTGTVLTMLGRVRFDEDASQVK